MYVWVYVWVWNIILVVCVRACVCALPVAVSSSSRASSSSSSSCVIREGVADVHGGWRTDVGVVIPRNTTDETIDINRPVVECRERRWCFNVDGIDGERSSVV
jgi:hypothetical protein